MKEIKDWRICFSCGGKSEPGYEVDLEPRCRKCYQKLIAVTVKDYNKFMRDGLDNYAKAYDKYIGTPLKEI